MMFTRSPLALAIADTHKMTTLKRSGWVGALSLTAMQVTAAPQNITPDAAFTTVTQVGATNEYNITNNQLINGIPVNIFNDFIVGDVNTVNLDVPSGNTSLVNIVKDSTPQVYGVLNSYLTNGGGAKTGLGGHIYFVSPYGFMVGASGIVNVGALTVRTPTVGDMDDIIGGTKAVTDDLTVSNTGLVTIDGKINAAGAIDIQGDQVDVNSTAVLIAGNALNANYVNYPTAAVNTGDFTAPNALISDGGTIKLVATSGDTGATVAGALLADGGITINAANINLTATSRLDTQNTDTAVTRGDVTLTATQSDEIGFGKATATTSITLDGGITANNISAVADSTATSSLNEDPELMADMLLIGKFAGIAAYVMQADATSSVTVGDAANLQAKGDIALNSISRALTESGAISINADKVGFGVVYNSSNTTASSSIAAGATLNASGTLSVIARNEAKIAASAFTLVTTGDNDAVAALAIGESDVSAQAVIASGANLTADNLVLSAENQNHYSVAASATSLEKAKYGIAIAIGDFNTDAVASMGASLGTSADKTGDVTITAIDRTVHQQVKSSVTVGAGAVARAVKSKISTKAANQTAIQDMTAREFDSQAPEGADAPKDSTGKISFKGGLAFTLNLSEHDAYAHLGNNVSAQIMAPEIQAKGNVVVASAIDLGTDNATIAGGNDKAAHGADEGAWRTSAESEVNGADDSSLSEKSVAAALSFAVNAGTAIAEIGDNVTINAANVGVLAQQKIPIVSSYDTWDSFGSVISKLNGIAGQQNNILTSFVKASASADKDAYGGALNVVWNDMDTKAWIGDNVSITTSGDAAWSGSRMVSGTMVAPGIFGTSSPFKNITYDFSFQNSVDVLAYNLNESINMAGNMGALGIIPSGTSTNEQGKSVGGAINFVQQSAQAVAGIGAATITTAAAGDVNIGAVTDERHFLITPSSGKGAGTGFNGVLSILNSEVLTHASLSNLAQVNTNSLRVLASHEFGNWSASGALAQSDSIAVGLSIAINISQGDTKAFIGDNSAEKAKVTSAENPQPDPVPTPVPAPTAPTPGIMANEVRVRGTAAGTNGALALAGAVTSEKTKDEPGKPGYKEKFQGYWSALKNKLSSSATNATDGTDATSLSAATEDAKENDTPADSGATTAQVNADKTGWGAAGSFTVSVNNIDAKAIIDGAVITGREVTATPGTFTEVDVQVEALDSVASFSLSGGAAWSKISANDPPQTQNTIAGAIAYQISFNDALARIQNSTIDHAGDVKVSALHGGELVSVGLALAVTTGAQTSTDANNGALSISGAQIYDGTSSRIDNSTISSNDYSVDTLSVLAYNNASVGVGGGALYYGGKKGGGLAITFAEINDPSAMLTGINPDSNNVLSSAHNEDVYSGAAVEAVIDGGSGRTNITGFDDVVVSAKGVNRIGIGAASGGYSGQEDSAGYSGSIAVGSIGADTQANLLKSDITGAQTLTVNASGEQEATLDTQLSDLGTTSDASGFDYSGSDVIDATSVVTNEDGTVDATKNYDSEGKRIIVVAGVLQWGGSNVGLSYAHADIKSETVARMADVNAGGLSDAAVIINARDDALLYTVAVGLGVSKGKYAGVGSVAVNRLNNKVLAEIGDWTGADAGTVRADTVTVSATNDMTLVNVAGAVAVGLSSSTGVVGGLAVALNLVGTDEHSTRARISNTNLVTSGDVMVHATNGSIDDENLMVGNAIGIAGTGGSGSAFAGAITVNNVDQTIQSAIKNTGENRTDDATSAAGGTISVLANDFTDSVATAWMGAAGLGGGNAGGIAIATNRVDSDVTAEVLGDNTWNTNNTLRVRDLIVDAARDNWLLTISAGVAVSTKQSAGAGSVSTGVVDGNVTARIAEGAFVEAYNNVLVNADAKTVNLVGSGAIGVGLGNAAGAVAIATAVEYGKTTAELINADVIAKGLGDDRNINNGDLSNTGTLGDISGAEGMVDSTPTTPDYDRDSLTTGFATLNQDLSIETASGLMVNATSRTKQRAITVGGAGGKSSAININVATNSSSNETLAKVANSQINQGITTTDQSDVLVRASAHEASLAVSAGLAVSGGSGGVGGFATNSQNKSANVLVDSTDIGADKLTLDATGTKVAQGVAAGVSVGTGTLGATASVVITEQLGNTKSWLHGGTVTANALDVLADRRQEASVAAGSVGVGGKAGVGAGLVVNIIGGNAIALIGNDLSNGADNALTRVKVDAVNVQADRMETVNSYAFGIGAGAKVGVAGMINVTEMRGETRAAIHGKVTGPDYTTTLTGKDGTTPASLVAVDAQELLYGNNVSLSLAAGSIAVGAVANVLLGRSQVYAEVVGSDIKSTLLDIDAAALREGSLFSAAAAVGKGAAAVSLGVALFGQGDTTATSPEDDETTNGDDDFEGSRGFINDILSSGFNGKNSQLNADDNVAMGPASNLRKNNSLATKNTTTASGSSLKISGESVTAARISGGRINVDTLNVNSNTKLYVEQELVGVVAGAVGVAGVVGITRLYDMTIATVDSDVTAKTLVVDALAENKSAADAAAEAKAWSIGVGGVVVVANIMDVRSEQQVVAGIASATGDNTGDLTVNAHDATELRIGDLDDGVPGNPTDGSVSVTLGSAAIGVAYGFAEKASKVNTWLGSNGQSISGYNNINVGAKSAGMVKTTAFALGGGISVGIQGVITRAHDISEVNATVYGDITTGSGVMSVSAQSAPELYSSAFGVTLSGSAAMGGSFSYATTDTIATAEIADNVTFSGGGKVVVRSETGDGADASYRSAHAKAFAGSGGLLLGLAGSEADATSRAQSVAKVGNNVTIPDADFEVTARNTGVQIAEANGYFVGAIAGGYQVGLAQSYNSARVEMGSDLNSGFERQGALILDATNDNNNQVYTVAGGGGLVSGSAAEANINTGDHKDADGNYTGALAASVSFADWNAATSAIDAGDVIINAANNVEFFAGVDSTTVSAVGGSGAVSDVAIAGAAKVNIGQYVEIASYGFDIDAKNVAKQITLDNRVETDFETSVYSAGGGGVNGSAGLSSQHINGLNALVELGDHARLSISDLAYFSNVASDISIDAMTDFYVEDESRMEIGGAMQGAGAESDVVVTTQSAITLNNFVNLLNPVGEIRLGTHSRGSATSEANVTVWAAAGVAGGTSRTTTTSVNEITLGDDVVINAAGAISLYAGKQSNLSRQNAVTATAYTNVYNWTAIPIPAGNVASAAIVSNNNVLLGNRFNIASDGHINIGAFEGTSKALGEGVEKNPYMELFSAENNFGSSNATANNTLTFSGTGSITAGQYAYQWVNIDGNGVITSQLYRYGQAQQLANKFSSRANLQAYIDELNAEIDRLNTPVYEEVITNQAIDDEGNPDPTAVPTTELVLVPNTHADEINELEAQVALLTPVLNSLSTGQNNVIEVKDIRVSAGNVNLSAKNIVVAAGATPQVRANGSAGMLIKNQSDRHVKVLNLEVVNQTGGNVLVSGGGTLASNYIVEQKTVPSPLLASGINIQHAPTGPNALNADVLVDGKLTNLLGDVTINVVEGDLIQTSTIEANAINLSVAGTLLFNNPYAPKTFGRAPVAMVNFVDKWKPSDANDFVSYYLNDKYATQIANAAAAGLDGVKYMNWWLTGYPVKWVGSASLLNAYGYSTITDFQLYYNWAFATDYRGPDPYIRFSMASNDGTRGGSTWDFRGARDVQSELSQTATYAQVKAELGVPGESIVGEKVFINASRVDINGALVVGKDNNLSVTVGSTFDTKIQQYVSALGLTAGDTVALTPGETKRVRIINPNYGLYDWRYYIYENYTFDISANANTAGIPLTYDVGSRTLSVADVTGSGGGYVAIRGAISSTGPEGNITVRDGLGQIAINNQSQTKMEVGLLNAGSNAQGIIRITDLNKSRTLSQWYVHTPGQAIKHYQTTASAIAFDDPNSSIFKGTLGTSTSANMTYSPTAGQLYYFREGATIRRTYDWPTDGWFAKYPNTLGDWYFERNWTLEDSRFTNCSIMPQACSGGNATAYLTHTYDANYGYSTGYSAWNLSYTDYYGSGLTAADLGVRWAYKLDMDTHTYINASHNIAFGFSGLATGSINLASAAPITLKGNITNPNGTTTINAQSTFDFASGNAYNSAQTNITASGDIGNNANPLQLTTDALTLISQNGAINVNVNTLDAQLTVGQLSARYGVTAVADKSIVARDVNTRLVGDTLDITSTTGSIGTLGTFGNASTYGFINIASTGAVSLNAANDIAVSQATGDLSVGNIQAGGDVAIRLMNGDVTNALQQQEKSAEKMAYEATVWDSLNLLDPDAGSTTVKAYENQFTNKYHNFWMIKNRLLDDTDVGFAIDPSFVDSFALKYGITDPVALHAKVRSEYRALQTWFGDQVATPETYADISDAKGQEQKGVLLGYDYGAIFDDTGYDNALKLDLTGTQWKAAMVEGAKWTQSQLDISISAAALSAGASGQLTDRDPNVTASNVHVMVPVGSVGLNQADMVFNIAKDGTASVSTAQKSALLSAGPGDISTIETTNNIELTIRQLDPIKVDTTGELLVTAAEQIYLESASTVIINQIASANNDVRLIVDGAISGKAGTNHFVARDLYVANTQGDIGSQLQTMYSTISGVLRQAGAANNLYLTNIGSDLIVGSVEAGGSVTLTNNQNIFGNDANHFVKGNGVTLNSATSAIGSLTERLNVALTGTNPLSVTAGNAFINILNTPYVSLGAITVDQDFDVTTLGSVDIDDDLSATNVTFDVNGNVAATAPLALTGTGLLDVSASDIDLSLAAIDFGSSSLTAQSGNIDLDKVTINTGSFGLWSAGAINLLDDVLVNGTDFVADSQSITMTSGTTLNTAGSASFTALNAISLETLTIGGDLDITAKNNLDALQGSVALLGAVDTQAMTALSANGMTLSSYINAASIDLDAGTTLLADNAITVDAVGALTANAQSIDLTKAVVTAGSGLLDASTAALSLGTTTINTTSLGLSSFGPMDLVGDILVSGTDFIADGQSITMTSGTQLQTAGNATFTALDAISLETLTIGGDLGITAKNNLDALQGSIAFHGAVDAVGIDVDTANQLDLSDAVILSAAGDAALNSGTLTMGIGSELNAAGTVALTTGSDMQLAKVTTDWDGANAFVVNSGGTITGRSDTAVHLTATGANAQAHLLAGLGIGNPLVIDMPWLEVETTQGDINIVAQRGFYSPLLKAANGDVHLKVHGDLAFGDLIGNPYLWIDGTLDGELIILEEGKLASSKGLNIDQIDLFGEGPLVLQSPNITITLDSQDSANTNLSMTGFDGLSATSIDATVVNTDRLTVLEYNGLDGSIAVDGDLRLLKALSRNSLNITTGELQVSLDNVDPSVKPVDGQLQTPYGQYWLDIQDQFATTNAVVTRYSDPMLVAFKPDSPDLDLSVAITFERLSAEYLTLRDLNAPLLFPNFKFSQSFLQPFSFDVLSVGINREEEFNVNSLEAEETVSEQDAANFEADKLVGI